TVMRTEPDGADVELAWDAASNLVSVAPPGRPAHAQTFSPVHLLTSYVPPVVDAVALPSTTFLYDADRALTTTTRPDGVVVTRSYDAAGRLSLLTMPTGT